jgi:hypothetical protein
MRFKSGHQPDTNDVKYVERQRNGKTFYTAAGLGKVYEYAMQNGLAGRPAQALPSLISRGQSVMSNKAVRAAMCLKTTTNGESVAPCQLGKRERETGKRSYLLQ